MLHNDDITSTTASEAVEKVPTEENDCHTNFPCAFLQFA